MCIMLVSSILISFIIQGIPFEVIIQESGRCCLIVLPDLKLQRAQDLHFKVYKP